MEQPLKFDYINDKDRVSVVTCECDRIRKATILVHALPAARTFGKVFRIQLSYIFTNFTQNPVQNKIKIRIR